MKSQSVVYGGYVLEVDCVGDSQTLHTVGMAPFLKVHFEGTATPVAVVSTNLAFVLYSKSVEFVKPVGNWLAVPSQWKVFRVVNGLIRICLAFGLLLLLNFLLFVAPGLLLTNQVHRVVEYIG